LTAYDVPQFLNETRNSNEYITGTNTKVRIVAKISPKIMDTAMVSNMGSWESQRGSIPPTVVAVVSKIGRNLC